MNGREACVEAEETDLYGVPFPLPQPPFSFFFFFFALLVLFLYTLLHALLYVYLRCTGSMYYFSAFYLGSSKGMVCWDGVVCSSGRVRLIRCIACAKVGCWPGSMLV